MCASLFGSRGEEEHVEQRATMMGAGKVCSKTGVLLYPYG